MKMHVVSCGAFEKAFVLRVMARVITKRLNDSIKPELITLTKLMIMPLAAVTVTTFAGCHGECERTSRIDLQRPINIALILISFLGLLFDIFFSVWHLSFI